MVVDGFGVDTKTPPAPTFIDVLPSHIFYPWVEGGVDADMISGYPDGTYRPNSTLQRQQANTILARYLSGVEKDVLGGIQGEDALYPLVSDWYQAEGRYLLAAFADGGKVASAHAPGTAYLIYHDVVEGSFSGGQYYLQPATSLNRAQAAAMILRVRAVEFEAQVPSVTGLNPASGPAAGGNSVVITGTSFVGLSGAGAVKFGGCQCHELRSELLDSDNGRGPAGTVGSTVRRDRDHSGWHKLDRWDCQRLPVQLIRHNPQRHRAGQGHLGSGRRGYERSDSDSRRH